MNLFRTTRLSSKLMLANLLYLLGLAGIVSALVFLGFRQTRENATSRSVEALTAQGRETLRQLTEQEATFAGRQLQQAAALGRSAADYLVTMRRSGGQVPYDRARLATAPNGQRYDEAPERRTEVWIGAQASFSTQLEQDLQESAVFDALFPTLVEQSPEAIAIYYMTPSGLGRYYPIVQLVDRLPADFNFSEQPFYALAAPQANPAQATVWSPPYEDFVGLGPIVTASTPVHDGEAFLGVIGVDISLIDLIERLNRLSPSPGGYAFLVDGEGRFVAASPRALTDLIGATFDDVATLSHTETLGIPLQQSDNEQVLQALQHMLAQESGLVQLELRDGPALLAYAPLPVVGWSLGLVAPVDQIAAQAEAVAAAIQEDATATLQSTMVALLAFFLVALLVIALISRRLIVQRVAALLAGTRAVAGGDLDVRLDVQSEDELGQLADSFNEMATQLAASRNELAARVASRTRELAALFDVTAVASSSLKLEEVLSRSLARVVQVMRARHGSIHMLDAEQGILKLAAAHNGPPDVLRELEKVGSGEAIVGRVVQRSAPLYVPHIGGESRALPVASRELAQHSYLGAPMRAKGETIGVLSVVGQANQSFGEEEVALLAAIADQVGVAVENARLYEQAEALAVVQERQRLARELHDAVTQSVYSLTLLAETGRRAGAAGDWDVVANLMERLQTIAGQALKELRLLVYELRPSALENAGLVEALRHRLDAVERRAGIDARLVVQDDIRLDEAQETAVYRVAVEALNNALKHAEAGAVTVHLQRQDGEVILTVTDDGQGFDVESATGAGGMGLSSMRERAAQLDGTLTIESNDEKGTVVRLRLGAAQEEEEHE